MVLACFMVMSLSVLWPNGEEKTSIMFMKIMLERMLTNIVELIKIHVLVMSRECPLHFGNVELTFYVECYSIVILAGAARNAKYSILVAQMRAGPSGGRRKTDSDVQGRDENKDIIGKV